MYRTFIRRHLLAGAAALAMFPGFVAPALADKTLLISTQN